MNAIITSPFIVPEQKNIFTSGAILAIFRNVLATSSTEPQNSTLSQTANSNTPFQRVISVCSFRTPQERLERQSMVTCNRKGSPFAVHRLEQFLSLLHVTAKSLRTLAVAVYQIQTEQIAMIFKFLCLDREANTYQTAVLTLEAPDEDEARWQLSSRWKLLLDRPIARFSDVLAINGGQA